MLNEDWLMRSVVFWLLVVLSLGCYHVQSVAVKWPPVFFQGPWASQIVDGIRCQSASLSLEVFVFTSEIPPIVTDCVSAPIEEAGLCQLGFSPLKTSKNLTKFTTTNFHFPLLLCRIIKHCSLVNEMPSIIIKVILIFLPLQQISRDLVKIGKLSKRP